LARENTNAHFILDPQSSGSGDAAIRLVRNGINNEELRIIAAAGGASGQNNTYLFDTIGNPNARDIQFRTSTNGGASYSNTLKISSSGNVGVGTTNPTAKLEIADAGNASLRLGISNNASNAHAQIRQSLHTVAYNQTSQATIGAVSWNHYNDGNSPSFSGTFLLHNGAGMTGVTYGVPTANSGQLVMQNCDNAVIATNGMTPIHISPFGKVAATFVASGNVGIGETNPQHKLAVNGTIKAKEIIVETTGWSDYVFASDYRLAPLSEVEAHIAEKKHLPGIPSAAEVAEKGVNVAQVQAALLAKVEELTLHLIAQEKALLALKAENAELKSEIKTIKQR
jgi:hypothetical protein